MDVYNPKHTSGLNQWKSVQPLVASCTQTRELCPIEVLQERVLASLSIQCHVGQALQVEI